MSSDLGAGAGAGEVPVRSVMRAIDVLMALSRGPTTLAAIAASSELSKATAHRILAALNHKHLVIQDHEGQYMLGPGSFELARAVSRGAGSLGVTARSSLEELSRTTSETVTLHIQIGVQRVCIDEVLSPEPLRYTAEVGSSAPLHVGSAGKVLLAFSEPAVCDALLSSIQLVPLTENTITDEAALRRELAQVRRRGWAQSRGERVSAAAAISVPVLGPAGYAIAALSILGPAQRMTDEVMGRFRPLLLATGEHLAEVVVGSSPAA
jgi:DNA-binding IclR family transcriptional regulator